MENSINFFIPYSLTAVLETQLRKLLNHEVVHCVGKTASDYRWPGAIVTLCFMECDSVARNFELNLMFSNYQSIEIDVVYMVAWM